MEYMYAWDLMCSWRRIRLLVVWGVMWCWRDLRILIIMCSEILFLMHEGMGYFYSMLRILPYHRIISIIIIMVYLLLRGCSVLLIIIFITMRKMGYCWLMITMYASGIIAFRVILRQGWWSGTVREVLFRIIPSVRTKQRLWWRMIILVWRWSRRRICSLQRIMISECRRTILVDWYDLYVHVKRYV